MQNEVTKEWENFSSIIHMYYVYLSGYFGGNVNQSDAPVIIIPHSEWLFNPEAVVNRFVELGLERNNRPFDLPAHHSKHPLITRDQMIERAQVPLPQIFLDKIGDGNLRRFRRFYSTGIDPDYDDFPEVGAITSKAVNRPSPPPVAPPPLPPPYIPPYSTS